MTHFQPQQHKRCPRCGSQAYIKLTLADDLLPVLQDGCHVYTCTNQECRHQFSSREGNEQEPKGNKLT